ncbi:hypothetical protein [Tistrella mobilis]|uniref:DUF2188 domain-containing protein n=1 Tax=Tistrella mobilis (strain KA081020-065) TaxID=1110502 RepID=I3TT80_TISMK|nr:hypothetical protein [Tistrella mobilis]AFK55968.1 hypothetical protein TMO_a0565 [Tistrella mobilis KA081020-065]
MSAILPIEVAGEATGFVTPEPRGFRFHAASGRYRLLDGSRFPSPETARAAAQRLRAAQDDRRQRS